MKKITGYLIDVVNNTTATVTIDKTLDEYYRILNCDCIDIVERTIGDRQFDIICDDEALLKDNPKISAVNTKMEPMLCGNLFIVKFDGKDDVTSLNKEELEYVDGYIHYYTTLYYSEPYPVLTGCNY